MNPSGFPRKKVAALCVLGALGLSVWFFSRGPDFQIRFRRELQTQLSPGEIDPYLRDLRQWPKWFHSLKGAEIPGQTSGHLEPGATPDIVLYIRARKSSNKVFTLYAKILQYAPGHRLAIRMMRDSTGKLDQLFDPIDWVIELEPVQGHTLLRGLAVTRTRHWRARFFGRLTDEILMNQIFYPDLFKLSKINFPTDESLPPVD